MSDSIKVIIDGKECTCEKGEYLFDVAKRNGIFIPTLCRHDGLEPRAACRVCIVEVVINGRGKVVTSCLYPIERDCEVFTNNDRIKRDRKGVITLLAARAPESERIAKMAGFYGATVPDGFVKIDGGKCILCGLCMQACESLGTGAISTVMRGTEKDVGTPYAEPSPDCVGCCTCAQVCPTDAIEWQQTEDTRTIWDHTFDLVRCERCGEIMGTKDEVAWAAKRAGADAALLCDECRKHAIADAMCRSYGR